MDDTLRYLIEKDAIADTLIRLFVGTDQRDWETVRACFDSRVHFDMSSMTGNEPAEVPAEQIVDDWNRGLRHLRAVHHQAGNFRVTLEGDQAEAFCYAIASHYLPNASGQHTRSFVGSYDFHLQKKGGTWRIDRFRFNLKYIDGNLELEGELSSMTPS